MNQDQHDLSLLQRFKSSAEQALPGRIARMVLFGSRARGGAKPNSDWDVAVFLVDRASSRDTLALADAAYDLIVESGHAIHPIALSVGGQEANPLLLDRIAMDGITV
jgi:predicted nucleotidyltransferase